MQLKHSLMLDTDAVEKFQNLFQDQRIKVLHQ